MTFGKRAQLAVFTVAILVLAGAFGIYYSDESATLAGQRQIISSLQSTVNSLVSHSTASTITSTTTEYDCVPEDLGLSEVTSANGSEAWFPDQVCLSESSTYFPAISAIYSDPRFTALENGSSFIFFDQVVASRGPTNNVTDQFLFNDYVMNDTFAVCGSKAAITPVLAQQIYVDVIRYSSNGYDMAHAEFGVTGPGDLVLTTEGCSLEPLVLPLGLILPRFGYDGVIFNTICNGLACQPPGSSTIDPNYNLVLNITVGSQTQTVDFRWGASNPNALPSPASYVSYFFRLNGNLHINWFLQTSTNGVPQAYFNATIG